MIPFLRSKRRNPTGRRRLESRPPIGLQALVHVGFAALVAATVGVGPAQGDPLPATLEDFHVPGTQPLDLLDGLATPTECTGRHSDFEPSTPASERNEPWRLWQGSMMAQAGRDPLMWAALDVANQDVAHSGETCLRCHLPRGWLEGRSTPEDGSEMTAADRQGVQCTVCHRMVDPQGSPGAPAEDADVLAALDQPLTSPGNANFVIDPLERLRGPFDVTADNGGDPHAPLRATLVSPFHRSAALCGTCHDVRNPIFTCAGTNTCVPNAFGMAGDAATGFPEQTTYSEWLASDFAEGGIALPRFGGTAQTVSTCQDCHMPDVRGEDAKDAPTRNDLPRHVLVGANTFVPRILPHHPVFGSEVDATILDEGIERARELLRRAVTLEASLAGGTLTLQIINETGHKLPTGYPEGRRMWLHVRAYDARDRIVFESGRYNTATATLAGYGTAPGDPGHDPELEVFEVLQGLSEEWAATIGRDPGKSFHLVLNDRILKDNRIPPRGFDNASFDAFGSAPVGVTYADGQYWADVSYPVGTSAVRADVALYYQTAAREYVEFLHDEAAGAAGPILHDLWSEHGRSEPEAMARLRVESTDTARLKCARQVSRAQARHLREWLDAWQPCFANEAAGLACAEPTRDAALSAAGQALTASVGGLGDPVCTPAGLGPLDLGHEPVCPAPCEDTITLFDLGDLAACAACVSEALGGTALHSAYGVTTDETPSPGSPDAAGCGARIARAATGFARSWTTELARCAGREGSSAAACDAAVAPRLATLEARLQRQVGSCAGREDLAGCGSAGDAAAIATCITDEIGTLAAAFAEVAWP